MNVDQQWNEYWHEKTEVFRENYPHSQKTSYVVAFLHKQFDGTQTCIRSSVSKSTAAVASSRIRTLVFLSRALAKHISWRWPTLLTER
jgi:hypothetical protein